MKNIAPVPTKPITLAELCLPKSHNWLIHKLLLDVISGTASKYATGILVDIGCGRKPWESLFAPFVSKYVGVDHEETLHDLDAADVVANAYETTIGAGQVDTVILINVLEHLEDPFAAAKEIDRILRSGGHAIVVAPMFWHVHEAPRDFYRFTPFGFRYVFESAGLTVVELTPISGFYITFIQEFCYVVWDYARFSLLRPLVWCLVQALQWTAWAFRRWDKNSKFSVGHIVVLRKP